jgi:hypothetical protein
MGISIFPVIRHPSPWYADHNFSQPSSLMPQQPTTRRTVASETRPSLGRLVLGLYNVAIPSLGGQLGHLWTGLWAVWLAYQKDVCVSVVGCCLMSSCVWHTRVMGCCLMNSCVWHTRVMDIGRNWCTCLDSYDESILSHHDGTPIGRFLGFQNLFSLSTPTPTLFVSRTLSFTWEALLFQLTSRSTLTGRKDDPTLPLSKHEYNAQ